ncbi:serine/threonine protein kinase [bacterium]|nr:serine/threonine protein kinase [bacterium]
MGHETRDGKDRRDIPVDRKAPRPESVGDDLDETLPTDLPTMASAGPVGSLSAPEQAPGEIVGNYRLLEVLGKGGMGVVYEAEQQNPRRKVALKIIRGRHHADEFHVRMFHREAEMLGRLRHPNIAAIYESGHTDDGRHFFAMELARGETLDRWTRRRDLAGGEDTRPGDPDQDATVVRAPLTRADVASRLRLFLKICDAVNYAHQRGVIHRDLKPSNIVICDHGGTDADESAARDTASVSTGRTASAATLGSTTLSGLPEVKVLDFGLARIMDPESEDATMLTQAGSVRGTPAYMSPEQAGGNPDETDLRCDIYSLGVILYELLAGVRPLELGDASLFDALQIVRDQEPTPLRRASARTWRIDADLETVVHKALDKDRERRYQSVAGLAMDIERFLNHEPVLAAPPSATYKLRKLVRRHRSFFAALAVVVVVLVGATIVSSTLFVRAERESARARLAARESEQIAAFLTEMLQGVGPSVARGSDTRMLREILDHTAERIGEELADQPEVEATLRTVLGRTYRELGEYEAAEPHLGTALEIRRRTRGPDDPAALESLIEIAALDYYQGHMARAESLYVRAGDRLTATVGPEDTRTLAAQAGLILVLTYQGKLDAAAALGEAILPLLRRHEGDDSEITRLAMYHLAQTYADQLRYAESESLYVDLLAMMDRDLGPDHPRTLSTRSSLGWLYRLADRHQEAETLTAAALADMRRILGDDHSETLIAVNNLAIIYKDLERYAEAEPLYLESLESGIRIMGEAHPENLPSMVNLAAFYQAQERYDEAYRLADRAVTVFTDVMPEGHIGLAFAHMSRGLSLFEQRRPAAAEADLLFAHGIMYEYFGPQHPHVRNVCEKLALICEGAGRTEEADGWRKMLEPDDGGASG